MPSKPLSEDSFTPFARLICDRPRRATRITGAALATIAVLLSGCDRQNADAPQAEAASAGAAPASGAAPATPLPPHTVETNGAGRPLPTTELRGPDGGPAKLSSLSGKPTIVNLWATWCAPCVAEMPTLNTLAERLGDRARVVALSQDIEDDSGHYVKYLADNGWTSLQPWHDPDNAVSLRYGGALPTTILFDASGREVLRVIGPLDWTSEEATRLVERLHITL